MRIGKRNQAFEFRTQAQGHFQEMTSKLDFSRVACLR